MRIVLAIVFVVVAGGAAIWVAMTRRKQLETPQLATVAGLLGSGAQADSLSVRGTLDGRHVEYRNRNYKSSRWTELSVDAADAKLALEIHERGGIDEAGIDVGLGDHYAVTGSPEDRVRALLDGDLRAQITALHPHKIRLGKTVEIVASRLIETDADAQALVRLGVALATRAAR